MEREIERYEAAGTTADNARQQALRAIGALTQNKEECRGPSSTEASQSVLRRRGLFYGVRAWDFPTFAMVGSVLIVAALLASYVPAHRAASTNPIEALRSE